ncbi:MAG: 2-oxoacid:acceptor oxidoreductase family protein, partial [Calditrichaeota bacterium]|nr:2-oxoacid:acceptor oxidoreductase family protein [Calditrichota bacterium]
MKTKEQESVVIRLAGDSGDGMQLIGTELANTSALFGNDIGTLPDFPAEIRAPRGTVAGVSGYQLHIGSFDIHTPGDEADCLVAMNPAALKSNIKYLKPNAALVLDIYSFNDKNLKLAGYDSNPMEDGSLHAYQLFPIDITQNTRKILDELDMGMKDKDRCKNFYALGIVSWLFER